MEKSKPQNMDEYFAGFPLETQQILQEIRTLIHKIAPNAKEVISYAMPAFKQNKVLVYFAGYKNHIGFYPTATGIEKFKNELTNYKWSKGAIQFPLNKALPIDLISRIVLFKLELDLKGK